MRIYFAHSIKEYNTAIERGCISIIKQHFPGCEIINPKDLYFDDFSEYLRVVEQCDILVYKRWNGYITAGVAKEIEHALSCDIPVYEIKGPKLIKVTKLDKKKTLTLDETRMAYSINFDDFEAMMNI